MLRLACRGMLADVAPLVGMTTAFWTRACARWGRIARLALSPWWPSSTEACEGNTDRALTVVIRCSTSSARAPGDTWGTGHRSPVLAAKGMQWSGCGAFFGFQL